MKLSFILPEFRRKKKLNYIVIAIILPFIVWIIFKLTYQSPFITIDSYYYIEAAYENANVGSWPIGYSKFIRLVGVISHSPTLLVSVQFILLYTSFIYFFFTVQKIFELSKYSTLLCFLFLFLNPIFFFACNHIMSDILFCSLAICWTCQILWIIRQPKPYMIISQSLLLTTLFTVRYTALFFPFITIIAFVISNQPKVNKLAGIGLSIISLASFIQFTRIEMEKISGVRQFSSAAGWKQASNALYMYEHIVATDSARIPKKFSELHQITKKYFNGEYTHVDLYHIDDEFTTGSYYVAAFESPLMQYLRIKRGKNADVFDFKNIGSFGPFFNEYGSYLILRHPYAYLQYVIIPNIMAYIFPFPEVYGSPDELHYLWSNQLGTKTKKWFRISKISIPLQMIRIREYVLQIYPSLFAMIHTVFVSCLVTFFLLKLHKKIVKSILYPLALIVLICISNFIFTILSAASVLRFQFVFIILEFTISIFIIELLYQLDKKNGYGLHPIKI